MKRAIASLAFLAGLAGLAATAVGHRAVDSDQTPTPPPARTICGCQTNFDCLYGNFGCDGAGFSCVVTPYGWGTCIVER